MEILTDKQRDKENRRQIIIYRFSILKFPIFGISPINHLSENKEHGTTKSISLFICQYPADR